MTNKIPHSNRNKKDGSFVYFCAYAIQGLLLPEREISLGEIEPGVEVFLLRDLSDGCRDADQAIALMELLLGGLQSQPEGPTVSERIQSVVERIQQERSRAHPNQVFVLFLCKDGVRAGPEIFRELEGWRIGNSNANDDEICSRFDVLIRTTLTTIALKAHEVTSFQKVVDRLVFYLPDGAPIFTFRPKFGNARIRLSKMATSEDLRSIAIQAASKNRRTELKNVQNLLVESFLSDGDRLRAFLCVWTGLEGLVKQLFKRNHLTIREIKEGESELELQFNAIAAFLNPKDFSNDLDRFCEARKLRNKIIHVKGSRIDNLPLEDTSYLLRKYLNLHLKNFAQ